MWLKNLTNENFNFAHVKKVKCKVFISQEGGMGMVIMLYYINKKSEIFFNGSEDQGKHIKTWLDSKLNAQEPPEECW